MIAAAAATAALQNPFPGLRPFREEEEYLFFGRESQVDAMIDKLAATRFLSVVGTSGSGKSSLVNCGLRPALHRGLMTRVGTTWRMAQFRPGTDPVRGLAGALAADGVLFRDYRAEGLPLTEIVDTTLRMSRLGLVDIVEQARLGDDVNLLVVVDQFEELFRYRQVLTGGPDDAQGAGEAAVAFVNLLLEAAQQPAHPIHVVLTMRSDFLGDCAQFPGLAEAINAGQYLVPRLTRDERRAAITGPVGVGGAEIEPVLLTRLLNDVGDNPDQLSILQHALNRTWAQWQAEGGEGQLRLAHYEAVGTMAHALDRHAESAYEELATPRAQELCEKIFKALTDKATDPRGVRRPTTVGTLGELASASSAEVAPVIETFREPSRSFLMPPAGEALEPETVVDISHESLMRVWQRLDTWAGEEAESARTYRRLAEDAAQHAAGKASLLRDPELQLALDWRDRNKPNECWASRYHPGFAPTMGFLAQSSEARDRERRAARRRIGVLIVLVLVLAAACVAAVLLANEAQHRRRDAENASKAATLLALTATANDHSATPLSSALLLSLAAYRKSPSFVSRRSVVLSLEEAATQPIRLILRTHMPAAALAVSPDGRTVATADRSGRVRRWDLGSHERVGPTSSVVDAGSHTRTNDPSVAFGPDGTLAEGTDARLTLWDAAGRGVSLKDPGEHITGEVRTVAFAPRGRSILAAAGYDGHVRLWDTKTHRLLARLDRRKKRDPVNSLAFGPDGRTIAAGGDDGKVRIWDTRTGRLRAKPLQVDRRAVLALAFDRHGTLATAGRADTIHFWEVRGPKPKRDAHSIVTGRAILDLALSADGARVAAASDDGTVSVWRTGTRSLLFTSLAASSNTSRKVAFIGNRRLVSLSTDGSITDWSERRPPFGVALPGRVSVPVPQPGSSEGMTLPALAASPDGRILVAGGDKGLRLWDARTRKRLAVVGSGASAGATALAFSPDGKLLAVADGGDVRVWRADALPRLVPAARARFGTASVDALAFRRDGVLAAGDTAGGVYTWDARAPGARPRLVGHGSDVRADPDKRLVYDLAFSPDGSILATGGRDGTLRLWRVRDAAHTTPIGAPDEMKARAAIRSLAFSPRGRVIAVGSGDGTISLWSAVTRKELGETTPGVESVESVAFTTGGQVLVTAGDDGTIRFWDAGASLLPLGAPLNGHAARIRRVAVSRDASVLASAGDDGTVRLWPGIVWATADDLTARVCRLVAGGVTNAEWKSILRRVTAVAANEPRPDLCAG